MLSIGLTTNASSSSGSVSSVSNDHDHCYTKPPQGKEQNKRTAAQRKRQGQTFLTPANDNQDLELITTSTSAAVHVSSNNFTQDLEFQEGNNVLLMMKDQWHVARYQTINRKRKMLAWMRCSSRINCSVYQGSLGQNLSIAVSHSI